VRSAARKHALAAVNVFFEADLDWSIDVPNAFARRFPGTLRQFG
jgi:hypothetical protein